MHRLAFFGSCLVLCAACGGEGGAVGFAGAQDIGEFREVLQKGGVPDEEALDPLGFFQEHAIERPSELCTEPLCARAMLSVHRDWMRQQPQVLLHVDLATALADERMAPRPLDLVVVVDTSASMNEADRIGFVKSGLDALVDELAEGDRLAIISYDSQARTVVELGADAATLHQAVAGLEAQGSTNLYDGLELGLVTAASAADPARAGRVLLLSDGVPTRGVIAFEQIVAMADEHLATGPALSTVGVGNDYDPTLLTTLAEHGGGGAYFVEDAAAVSEVFSEELMSVLTPIARDVRLSITPGSSYRLGDAVGAPGIVPGADGVEVAIPGVFLATRRDGGAEGADDTRRGGGGAIFVEALLDRDEAPETVGRITLRYRAEGETEYREAHIDVDTPVAPGADAGSPWYSHDAMLKAYAVYNMFLGLRWATRAASCEYDCALVALDRLDLAATAFVRTHPDGDLQGDLELVHRFQGNLERKMAQVHRVPTGECPCGDQNEYCCPGGDNVCSMARPAAPSRPGLPLAALVVGLGGLAVLSRRRR
jgi:Ca-activated chloride channel homolog